MDWADRIGRRIKLHDLHVLMTVAELGSMGKAAERLNVTQPSISKSVADLERRGYVERRADPDDARARRVALTERGRAVIEAGRRHRAALESELAERLGPQRVDAARRLLLDAVAALGGEPAVRGRRVRMPT